MKQVSTWALNLPEKSQLAPVLGDNKTRLNFTAWRIQKSA